jgi:hypothetical protein
MRMQPEPGFAQHSAGSWTPGRGYNNFALTPSAATRQTQGPLQATFRRHASSWQRPSAPSIASRSLQEGRRTTSATASCRLGASCAATRTAKPRPGASAAHPQAYLNARSSWASFPTQSRTTTGYTLGQRTSATRRPAGATSRWKMPCSPSRRSSGCAARGSCCGIRRWQSAGPTLGAITLWCRSSVW